MKHRARAALAAAAMLTAAAAAAIAAVAIPASGSSALASSKIANVPVFPPTLVNYFFGELNPPNNSATWEWAGATDSENFANSTSRAVVTGQIALGSSNGLAVSGQLGVCYQQGTGPIMETAQLHRAGGHVVLPVLLRHHPARTQRVRSWHLYGRSVRRGHLSEPRL
jgi:hypothetical protein